MEVIKSNKEQINIPVKEASQNFPLDLWLCEDSLPLAGTYEHHFRNSAPSWTFQPPKEM